MKDFLAGISPGSDSDLLHLSEGSTDFIGCLDIELGKEDEEDKDD